MKYLVVLLLSLALFSCSNSEKLDATPVSDPLSVYVQDVKEQREKLLYIMNTTGSLSDADVDYLNARFNRIGTYFEAARSAYADLTASQQEKYQTRLVDFVDTQKYPNVTGTNYSDIIRFFGIGAKNKNSGQPVLSSGAMGYFLNPDMHIFDTWGLWSDFIQSFKPYIKQSKLSDYSLKLATGFMTLFPDSLLQEKAKRYSYNGKEANFSSAQEARKYLVQEIADRFKDN